MNTIGKTNFPPGGIDTSDATVVASDMKVGVTAYGAAGTKITGTMVVHASDQTASSITNSTTTLKFLAPAGFYDGSKYVTYTDSDFAAGNIRVGYNIFGIDGTFTNDANATAGQILASVTAYVNGSKITGTMTNQGAYNITPGTSNQSIPAGYHNGSGVVYGDANLVAGNIKNGVNIFGIDGNYAPGGSSNVNLPVSLPFYLGAGRYFITYNTCACSDDGKYIYVVTSSSHSSHYLCKSSDGGITWSEVLTLPAVAATTYILCSRDGRYVFVCRNTNTDVAYMSSNYGASFSNVSIGSASYLFNGCCMSDDGSVIYVSKNNNTYKSSNYGVSWSDLGNYSGRIIQDCSSNGSIVYAYSNAVIYKSTDGGSTWPTFFSGSYTITMLRCDSTGNKVMFVYGATDYYMHYYNGSSWSTPSYGYYGFWANRDLTSYITQDYNTVTLNSRACYRCIFYNINTSTAVYSCWTPGFTPSPSYLGVSSSRGNKVGVFMSNEYANGTSMGCPFLVSYN